MSNDNITFEEIVALIAGELDVAGRERVERRLSSDPGARELAERLRAALGAMSGLGEGPSAGAVAWARRLARRAGGMGEWLDKAGVALARLVFDSRRPGALAGLRGAGDGYHLRFSSEVGDIDIQVDPPAEPEGPRRVRGQVDLSIATGGAAVLLEAVEGGGVHRGEVDEGGMFEISAGAGFYELHVESAGGMVVAAAPVELT